MHPGWERDASASPALLHLGPRHREPSGAMHVENQSRQGRVGAATSAGSLGGGNCLWLGQPTAAMLMYLQAAPFPPRRLPQPSLLHHWVF